MVRIYNGIMAAAFGGALLLTGATSPAQTPAQMPAVTGGAPDWMRPSAQQADYVAGAKADLDAFEKKLTDARKQADGSGNLDRTEKLSDIARRLGDVRQSWERLPQANPSNWDTVRTHFEVGYKDLMRRWDEANKS